MNKLFVLIIGLSIIAGSSSYKGSTTASVTIVGGIIKAKHIEHNINKKYKRKDCPVCKGKGWYISGDDITKVNCGYCGPESTNTTIIRR